MTRIKTLLALLAVTVVGAGTYVFLSNRPPKVAPPAGVFQPPKDRSAPMIPELGPRNPSFPAPAPVPGEAIADLVAGQPEEKSLYALAITGRHYGSDVDFDDGENVFLLTPKTGKGDSLVPAQVHVKKLGDVATISDPNDSELEVSVDEKSDGPIFILRGPFQPGGVTSLAIPEIESCEAKPCELVVNNQKFLLRTTKILRRHGEDLEPTATHTCHFSDGTLQEETREMARIAWLGDLDRDGRLDVIVDDGMNARTGFTLFLSSLHEDRLMTRAAHFESGGGC